MSNIKKADEDKKIKLPNLSEQDPREVVEKKDVANDDFY